MFRLPAVLPAGGCYLLSTNPVFYLFMLVSSIYVLVKPKKRNPAAVPMFVAIAVLFLGNLLSTAAPGLSFLSYNSLFSWVCIVAIVGAAALRMTRIHDQRSIMAWKLVKIGGILFAFVMLIVLIAIVMLHLQS